MTTSTREISSEVDEIGRLARPLRTPDDLDPLLDRIGEARFVLLREASHGTAEYYRRRATITQRLITERGFSVVAVARILPHRVDSHGRLNRRSQPHLQPRQ